VERDDASLAAIDLARRLILQPPTAPEHLAPAAA
jgi:hypothetical protein